MMKMAQLVLVLFFVGFVSGPVVVGAEEGKAMTNRAQEEAAIRAADLAWSKTANRKDIDGTVSYMADDGETLAPNEPAARDKKSIRDSWAKLLSLPGMEIHWEPLRVQVAESGEIGYTSGVYTLIFTSDDGVRVTDKGKYVEIWKKVNGKWKCSSDIYNSDTPVQ